MSHEKVHDTASHVSAEHGEVLVDGPDGVSVSMTPDAAALPCRVDADILDQEIALARDHLDEPHQLVIDEGEVDHVMAYRVVVVGGHRQGFAADDGAPFQIGLAGEITYTRRVLRTGAAELDERRHISRV